MHGMDSFFDPDSVAVAGVSTDPNKMGSIIFANMLANHRKGLLRAKVYALNPSHDRIGDEPCYPSIGALPEAPELLIVAVPESMTTGVMREAGVAGVRAAVVVTSGYAEAGKGEVERAIGKEAERHGMRILGPNTIGLLDTRSGVDSLFLRHTKKLPDGSEIVSLLDPLKGGVAIITQSGHLGEMVSEQLAASGVGIRALVGTGNQLDVSVEDVLEYFADDPDTKVVAVYLEGLRDGRRFVEVARRAGATKPVVVFKVGKTDAGARAALTHTASLVGNYDVYRAAFRQAGVVEAGDFQDLVDFSAGLSMLPPARGDRLVILTNAGGMGAMGADEATRLGLQVGPLGEGTKERLRAEFEGRPFISNASLGNPVDLTASVTTEEFVRATKSIVASSDFDLALVIPTHGTPAIDYDVGRRLADVVSASKKPVAACVLGSTPLAGRIHGELMAKGIPSLPTPERAVRVLAAARAYAKLRRAPSGSIARKAARHRIAGRAGPLPHAGVSKLLRAYGIREPGSVVVESAKGLRRVEGLRFPVACKLMADGVVHKTEAKGILLGVPGVDGVKAAFESFEKASRMRSLRFRGVLVQEMVRGVEVILGGTRDPTFGPTVMFGMGGTYTELLRDYSLAVAPVSPTEAKGMLEGTKLGRVLAGFRGGPETNAALLAKTISDFSRILVENPEVDQLEINPLIVRGDDVLSVDARVILGRRPRGSQ